MPDRTASSTVCVGRCRQPVARAGVHVPGLAQNAAGSSTSQSAATSGLRFVGGMGLLARKHGQRRDVGYRLSDTTELAAAA
jgi:hypothetical protein